MYKNFNHFSISGSQDIETDSIKFKPAAFHLYKLYSTSTAYQVYPDFIEFARKFRSEKSDVKTVVISNFDKRISTILTQLGVMPFVDAIVYSQEAAKSKPDRKIFEKAIFKSELKDLKNCQILHVGDDLINDYKGSTALGWNSLLLNRKNLIKFEGVPNNHLCQDFHQVHDAIDKKFNQ